MGELNQEVTEAVTPEVTQEVTNEGEIGVESRELEFEDSENLDVTSLTDEQVQAMLSKRLSSQDSIEKETETTGLPKAESPKIVPPEPQVRPGETPPGQTVAPALQLQNLSQQAQQRFEQINQLKAQQIAALQHLQAKAQEIEADNPREAANIDRQIEQVKAELSDLDDESEAVQNYEVNLRTIPKYLPTELLDAEAMAQELIEDGFQPAVANDYVKNMLVKRGASEIINLGKRALYAKALKLLWKRNQELEAAKGGVVKNTNPDTVAQVINKARTLPKTLAPAPAAPKDITIDLSSIANLSNAELDALYEEKMKLNNGRY